MRLVHLLFFLTFIRCTFEPKNYEKESVKSNQVAQTKDEDVVFDEDSLATAVYHPIEIQCDPIYNGGNITVQLWTPVPNYEHDRPNSAFIFMKNGEVIYRDSVFSFVQQIEFVDYNRDGVQDILIQEYSDARSNWTYNLYLVGKDYMPEHIIEFSQIKNPNLNLTGDTIKSYVISGEIYSAKYLLDDSNNIIKIGESVIIEEQN